MKVAPTFDPQVGGMMHVEPEREVKEWAKTCPMEARESVYRHSFEPA